jgi:hypothetical protein
LAALHYDDPKLENDIIAITGSTPNILAVFAVMIAKPNHLQMD